MLLQSSPQHALYMITSGVSHALAEGRTIAYTLETKACETPPPGRPAEPF
jgi:hypothetical protein